MRLITILYKKDQYILDLFKSAARSQHIECIAIDPDTFDYFTLPSLDENDILYRISGGYVAQAIEKKLIMIVAGISIVTGELLYLDVVRRSIIMKNLDSPQSPPSLFA